MSLIKTEDRKKWIHFILAVFALIAGYVVIRFTEQMGQWFDLEAKVGNFVLVSQGVGIFLGLGMFVVLMRHSRLMRHMGEVYDELVKVVWPDNDSIVKATTSIIIALAIISSVFVGVDFVSSKLLELVY